jgi:hypothetical protein
MDKLESQITILILAFNGKRWLPECISSLTGQGRVVVIDNGSTDDTADFVREHYPHLELLQFRPGLGFGEAYNRAVVSVNTQYVAFINQDTVTQPNCLTILTNALKADSSVGIVGPMILNPDSSVQDRGSNIDVFGFPVPVVVRADEINWDSFFISGCLMVIEKDFFEFIGGFPDYLGFFFEDVDLCWRTWLVGRSVRVISEAKMIHFGGGSIPGSWMRKATSTSLMRTFFRERNALSVMVQNLAIPSLLILAPLYMANSLLESFGLFLVGNRGAARQYFRAWLSFWTLLPRIYATRKLVQRVRTISDRRILGRFFALRHRKIELIRGNGLPVFEK